MNDQTDISGLHSVQVDDESGQAHALHTLWARHGATLIFLPDFKAAGLRYAKEIWSQFTLTKKMGDPIYFIGNGPSREIASFKEDLGINHALVFTDPVLRSYMAVGFRRRIWFGQMRGILMVDKSGHIFSRQISQSLGDYPLPEDLETTAMVTLDPAQRDDYLLR